MFIKDGTPGPHPLWALPLHYPHLGIRGILDFGNMPRPLQTSCASHCIFAAIIPDKLKYFSIQEEVSSPCHDLCMYNTPSDPVSFIPKTPSNTINIFLFQKPFSVRIFSTILCQQDSQLMFVSYNSTSSYHSIWLACNIYQFSEGLKVNFNGSDTSILLPYVTTLCDTPYTHDCA